ARALAKRLEEREREVPRARLLRGRRQAIARPRLEVRRVDVRRERRCSRRGRRRPSRGTHQGGRGGGGGECEPRAGEAHTRGLATICGTQLCSQASPVCTEQSCMSLQRSGVTKLNFGKVPALSAEVNAPLEVVPIGTLSVPHAARIFV